jgi:hypothetical protein
MTTQYKLGMPETQLVTYTNIMYRHHTFEIPGCVHVERYVGFGYT